MTIALYERFVGVIKNEAEKLLKSQGNEINPVGVKKDGDEREYVYTLANIDYVLASLSSFEKELSVRKDGVKNDYFFQKDKSKVIVLPAEVVFYLRGYFCVVSEDSMVLEEKKILTMLDLLISWSEVDFFDGLEQNELSDFLWGYENESIKSIHGLDCERMNLEDFVRDQVKMKLKICKEVMKVVKANIEEMFNAVWSDYDDMRKIEEKEKFEVRAYIDKIVDAELQILKDDFAKLVQSSEVKMEELTTDVVRISQEVTALMQFTSSSQGGWAMQSTNDIWYKCPSVKAFGRSCRGKVKRGEYCAECGALFQ